MKYDLRKVEEVHYDVKIRGLASKGDLKGDQAIQETQEVAGSGEGLTFGPIPVLIF